MVIYFHSICKKSCCYFEQVLNLTDHALLGKNMDTIFFMG